MYCPGNCYFVTFPCPDPGQRVAPMLSSRRETAVTVSYYDIILLRQVSNDKGLDRCGTDWIYIQDQ